MENDINNNYENFNFITTNETFFTSDNDTNFIVCNNIYNMLTVLTFTIIVIFLFNFLKSTFNRIV